MCKKFLNMCKAFILLITFSYSVGATANVQQTYEKVKTQVKQKQCLLANNIFLLEFNHAKDKNVTLYKQAEQEIVDLCIETSMLFLLDGDLHNMKIMLDTIGAYNMTSDQQLAYANALSLLNCGEQNVNACVTAGLLLSQSLLILESTEYSATGNEKILVNQKVNDLKTTIIFLFKKGCDGGNLISCHLQKSYEGRK